MSAGFRDILAILRSWQSAHAFWQTAGPYRLAAAQAFCTGAAAGQAFFTGTKVGRCFVAGSAAGGTFRAGAAAAVAAGGNVIAGECNG
jgi:hypothetical protein